MSMRVVRNGSPIELPNDEPVLQLKIMASGKMELIAPTIHPKDVCKMLTNLAYDVIYGSLQQQQAPIVQSPLDRV